MNKLETGDISNEKNITTANKTSIFTKTKNNAINVIIYISENPYLNKNNNESNSATNKKNNHKNKANHRNLAKKKK